MCELDIHRMESKNGKLFFTKEKLLGKRFQSKHITQVNVEVAAPLAPRENGSKNSTSLKPFLYLDKVNQLVSTILQSEKLPKRVTRGKLKGVLKDIH